MSKLQDEIDKLNALGSAGAIAEKFRAEGIKGTKFRSETCPIARHLTNVGFERPRACQSHVFITGGETVNLAGTPASDFITAFDALKFPDLVA